ncbi:MAG TPA: hydroxymethylglutaryl-CoA lyase [Candidatus Acidoferrales bacterium]|nr:hydroxymethylglutaryl-CoA lyase [Candidatus Acidoferrales bacterium]
MMPEVKLIECPRDAWQGLRGQIPTPEKVSYLKALLDAGFRHIDAVSFVSPKAVPQMADSEDVLRRLEVPEEAEIIGIVVNEKGADRAIATGKVRTLGFPYSLSETFLRKNQNQSPEENSDMLEEIAKKASEAELEMVVYVSMAFGNPYGDPWDLEEVMLGIENIADMGVESISLADTVGLATPAQITELCGMACDRYEGFDLGVHLHTRPGEAADKILAAYDAGIRRFDSALGGLGGCPFAQDSLVGNVATEEVIAALAKRGVGFPLQSLDSLVSLSRDLGAHYAQR